MSWPYDGRWMFFCDAVRCLARAVGMRDVVSVVAVLAATTCRGPTFGLGAWTLHAVPRQRAVHGMFLCDAVMCLAPAVGMRDVAFVVAVLAATTCRGPAFGLGAYWAQHAVP
jgi:hypothetical protein